MNIKFNQCFENATKLLFSAIQKKEEFPFTVASLKGSRASGKTGHILRMLIIIGLMSKIKVFAFRYIASKLKQTLIKDFQTIFLQMDIPFIFSASTNTFSFGNSSCIQLFGLKQSASDKINLTGLGDEGYLYEYGFILLDEISEYERDERLAIVEAIRGFYLHTVLEIRLGNPVNPLHGANKHFKYYLHESEEIMKKIGYQERICFTEENGWNEGFSQSNIQVNHLCDQNVREKIEKLSIIDPMRARTMLYGLDGIDSEVLIINPEFRPIQTQELLRELEIRSQLNHDVGKFTISFDYGLRDASSMGLNLILPQFGIIRCDSFYYNRSSMPGIEDKKIVELAVTKINQGARIYPLNGKTPIFYDFQNYTIAELIKENLQNPRFYLEPCSKMELEDRLKELRRLFDNKRVYLNIDNPINNILVEEIKYAKGKFNSIGKLSEIITQCDALDDFCYGGTKISRQLYESIYGSSGKEEETSDQGVKLI